MKKTGKLIWCKRIVSILTAFVVLVAGFNVSAVAAVSIENGTITINTYAQLVEYSQAYRDAPASYCNVDLSIGITGDCTENNLVDFVSVGTELYPFDATITINTSNLLKIYLGVPLFAYISDTSIIKDTNGNVTPVTIISTAATSQPLFAENVVHNNGTEYPQWSVVVGKPSESNAKDFGGIIGTIGESAQVDLIIDNTVNANVSSTGNVGLVCGTMGTNSALNVTVKSPSDDSDCTYSVASSGGNSGGIVGYMNSGSTLTVNSSVKTTGTISAASGYAGGLVGYAKDSTVNFLNESDKTVTQTVSGTSGTGGIFGCYENTKDQTFDVSSISIDCTLNGINNGGLFGELKNTADMTISGGTEDNLKSTFTNSESADYGGIVGTCSGTGSTFFTNIGLTAFKSEAATANKYGGVIGNVSADAYISFSDVTVNASNCSSSVSLFGGLIAYSALAFIDAENVTVNTKTSVFNGGGIVGNLVSGVLRLSGTTDLSKAGTDNSTMTGEYGQIVKIRGNQALVYAKGSTGNEWKLIRNTTGQQYYDDIYSWGEVLRLDGTILNESDVLTVDETAHTVTVKAPTVTDGIATVSSLAEFAILALNIQLNESSDVGRLLFENKTNNSAALLGGNITLNTDIDLSGTGITGLTRDNGSNEPYKGTFNGNNHTITLAIGEAYGYRGDTKIESSEKAITTATAGNGVIYRHAYNGLFAKTGDGATFNELTVGGGIKVDTNINMYVGGLSAEHQSGNIKIDNVKSEQNVFLNGNDNGNYSNACGGFIGRTATTQAHTIDIINNSTVSPTITTESKKNPFYTGGAIGVISSTDKAVTVNADNVTISTTITNNSSSFSNYGTSKKAGGFIAYIASGTSENRTMSLKNITVDGTSIETVYGLGGALLGEQWNNIDVTIGEKVVTNAVALADGIVVLEDTSAFGSTYATFEDNSKFNDIFGKTTAKSSSAIIGDVLNKQLNDEIAAFSESESTSTGVTVTNSTVKYSGSSDFGGLVSVATGYWQVNDIDINGITVDGGSAYSFGMLVGRGVNRDNNQKYALYLETTDENAYTINASNTTLSLGSAVFDELVADCRNRNDSNDATGYDIASNSNAVVSIHTSTPLSATEPKVIMDGASCNTYQNQTDKAISNPNTRYYYNLDVIRAKKTDDLSAPEKLMLWSVYNYAYGTIQSNFNNPFTDNKIVAETYDMNGYSYYPIDISSATIESGCTFKFYNNEIETGESETGDTDTLTRSTVAADSQHYLMHCGLLRNVSAALTVDNITLQGNVGKITSGSGALICGTVSGSATSTANITVNGVTLDGVAVNDVSGYAPLLINNIGNYSKLTLKNVTTTSAYTTNGITIAATSLIGNVGGENGDQIKLLFGQLTLDSRKQALSNDTTNAALTNAYNTTTSIFSKATLLNSFQYTTGKNCSAIYNYKYTEDWTDATTPKHNVTYGTEITNSAEYANQEKNYIGSDYFTNPDTLTENDIYTFSADDFLPYVYTGYSEADNSHEVKVNVTNKANLDKGCGTYNDPYIIEKKDQIMLISEILNEDTPSQDGTIINWHADNYKSWCDSKDSSSHTVYVWDSDNAAFYPAKTDENGDTVADTSKSKYTIANMRTTLSTAYYKLGQDITLGADFLGLGTKTYFKGVIDGAGYTITNESKNPLIYSSSGSVVKNLNVSVTADFSDKFKVDATSKYETDGGDTEFYGGLIGIVNGGDNIIDNVSVMFADNNISKINVKSNSNYGNRAVGGYIGVVRYGGVFFRNMETATNKSGIALFNTTGYQYLLYCNPIIGRVIDGFVVTESDSYEPSEIGTTMQNGTKNYSIADIDKNGGQITFNDNAISVPDGQSLFIMGCIAMSGAGSANWKENYNFTSYVEDKMVRHAQYDSIGTKDTQANTTDFALVTCDSYDNSATKVPYIVYKYTEQVADGNYPARSLTVSNTTNCIFDITLSNEAAEYTYELPDSFRGIGSLYNPNDNNMQMFIGTFDGKNKTVKLNSSLYAYRSSNYDKYYDDSGKCGLGLFTTLFQNGSVQPNIKDVVITGNEEVIIYNTHSGSEDKNKDLKTYPVGAISGGCKPDAKGTINIESVKLSDITLSSTYRTGGLIGYIYGNGKASALNIKKCTSINLNATAGQYVGGMIGYAESNCTININEENYAENYDFNIDTIESKFDNATNNTWHDIYCAGGLIGYTNGNSLYINIFNMNVSGGKIVSKCNTGGIVGKNNGGDKTMVIKNCNVNQVDMYGCYIGGIAGITKIQSTFENCKVTGNSSTNSTMQSKSGVGGIYGFSYQKNVTINNCSVENYDLLLIIEGYSEYIGGFVGKVEDGKTLTVKNSIISNCTIKNETDTPTGGIIGYCSNKYSMNGYNIVASQVQFRNASDEKLTTNVGNIAGKLDSNCNVKLVVFCNNGSDIVANDIGSANNTGYVIYSDYNGACLSENPNTTLSTINDTNNVTDYGASPYATINPVLAFSGITLTGDGISGKATVESIISGTKYTNVSADKTTFADNYLSKLSTFNKEAGTSLAVDFPVLVVNDSDSTNITKMINSYLHLLTNDTSVANYAADVSGKYTVDISKYRMTDGTDTFAKISDDSPTLERSNSEFAMTNKDYDSNDTQFTLIDVQYYAPDTSLIAYHLYVPVMVEKMLKFDFSAKILSGTTYKTSEYVNNVVMESYGTPVTAYMSYSYKRTAQEWTDAINGGENLMTNYGKTVILRSGNAAYHFPENTQLVLVDRNKNGKAYYSKITRDEIVVGNTDIKHTFGDFKSADNTTAFESVSLCDLLSKSANITAEEIADSTGKFVLADESTATVRTADGNYYMPKPVDYADGATYNITVTPKDASITDSSILPVSEDYYLSIFTPENTAGTFNMVQITILSDKRLADDGMTPSRNDKNTQASMILGDLYQQTVSFKTTTTNYAITENNNAISAEVSSTISLKGDDANKKEVMNYLNNDAINVYHGFVIDLTKIYTDENGSVVTEKGVKGSPYVTGTYMVGGDSYSFAQTCSESEIGIIATDENGIIDISYLLKTGNDVVISCNDLKITYVDVSGIVEQFPQRKTELDNDGVRLSASSNLAYVQTNILHSNIGESLDDELNHYYYRETDVTVANLNYNVPYGISNADEFSKLGINGKEANDEISAVGYYDVANVAAQDLKNAKQVSVSLSLFQKQDDGSYAPVEITDYLTDIKLYDKNGNSFGGTSKIFDIGELDYDNNIFEIQSSYSVKTGTELERNSYIYSNYKVQMSVQLLDDSGTSIANSSCSDYIIYTNAKIYTELIPQ